MKSNLTILIVILISGFLIGANHYKDKLNVAEQNLTAATDSLNIIKDNNDKLLYEKSVYILKEKELNDMIGISKNEIKSLKKQLNSSLSYIAKLKSEINIDTIMLETFIPVPNDTINIFDFSYNNPWFNFEGSLSTKNNLPQYLELNNINIPTNLEVGLTEDNKMFIKPDNPYMKVSDIKGSYIIDNMINKEVKPKWSHGIQAGFGIQYGIGNKSFDFGPYIGYGITYNF